MAYNPNPFGFLIPNRRRPFAHALRTGLKGKFWAVWSVMNGQDETIRGEIIDIGRERESAEQARRGTNLLFKPRGMIDYLSLYFIWAPLLMGSLLIGMGMVLLPLAGVGAIGLYLFSNLRSTVFSHTTLGKLLLGGPALLVGAAVLAAMLTMAATGAAILTIMTARRLLAAALTVACVPFVLLAQGISWLAGRSVRNKANGLRVTDDHLEDDTLGNVLQKNKLSLDDIACSYGQVFTIFKKQKPFSVVRMGMNLVDKRVGEHMRAEAEERKVPICIISDHEGDVSPLRELGIPRARLR